jgi:hypothetical protein
MFNPGRVVPEWGTFFLIFQANHPSVAQRIEFANTYKPVGTGAAVGLRQRLQARVIRADDSRNWW